MVSTSMAKEVALASWALSANSAMAEFGVVWEVELDLRKLAETIVLCDLRMD